MLAAEDEFRVSLFEDSPLPRIDKGRPLAERMRPETLDDYVGQQHILAPGKPLRLQVERDQLSSMILWGPPGVGKTTLARLIANLDTRGLRPLQRRTQRSQGN